MQLNSICTNQNVFKKMRHKILWDFDIQMHHLIPARRPYHLIDFAFPADYRVKMKESKKLYKYLDLARELKKNVEYEGDSAYETVLKSLGIKMEELKIRRKIKIIKTTALLKSVRILRRVLEN